MSSEFEKRMNVPAGTYATQESLLRSGKLAYVILGGKMAAGKDTIAPLLNLPGDSSPVLLGYGEVLRRELKAVLPLVYVSIAAEEDGLELPVYSMLAERLGYRIEDAVTLYSMLRGHYREFGGEFDPWVRTDFSRTLLQLMGSDWLPDEDYLPRTASAQAMKALNEGNSVILTGGRFEPDVALPSLAGAICVRLTVDRETQLHRLMGRDGLSLTPELEAQLNHPGETALDSYVADIAVDNRLGRTEQEVADEVNARLTALLASRSWISSESFTKI